MSWSTSELRVRLAPWNQFKRSSKTFFLTVTRLYNVFLLWIICVYYVLWVSCFRVCSLLPCDHLLGTGWPLYSCWWCLIVILSLSHMVSWARCGTWLYWFLTVAVFVSLVYTVSMGAEQVFLIIHIYLVRKLSDILNRCEINWWNVFEYQNQPMWTKDDAFYEQLQETAW